MTFHHLLRHSLIPVSFIQTLTTLNLTDNRIEDQGAQYLGEVLQHNTVRSSLLLIFSLISFFSLSYRHLLHLTCRTIKSELKVHSIWVKLCDTIQWDHHFFLFSPSSHSCLFHTDTHYTHLSCNQIGAQGALYLERLQNTNSDLKVVWWFKSRFQFSCWRLITNMWNWIFRIMLFCACVILHTDFVINLKYFDSYIQFDRMKCIGEKESSMKFNWNCTVEFVNV